ncbi:hypothetical protein J437_LFUL005342 [Ladona fulva]|uniref:Uncharacterized protein n=1 Tax=Ladona fulva TaxID=123851 RepID=A0A8K0K3I9_LADFU|nr:hypothetical protein J437_LFUL005342 [Ladona fulva]
MVFSVKNEGHIFALMTVKAVEICGITVYATEHPKLFIAPKIGHSWFFKKTPMQVESVNLFTYLNSKFVYLERHVKHEMEKLYKNILEYRCSVNKQIWYNQFSLLTTSPIDFAYTVKQTPGYMAIVLGELVYITKCLPVNVQVRQATRCYQELPITYNNESFYMTPRHHLVTRIGTEVECSNILYSAYKLHGQWWGQTPILVHVPNPETQANLVHDTWKYQTSGDLIKSASPTSAEDSSTSEMEDLDFDPDIRAAANAFEKQDNAEAVIIRGLNLLRDKVTPESNVTAPSSNTESDFVTVSHKRKYNAISRTSPDHHIPTKNRFDPIANNYNQPNQPTPNPTQPVNKVKIPSIKVMYNKQWPNLLNSLIKATSLPPICQMVGSNLILVKAQTLEDYFKSIHVLKENNIEYYTYQVPSMRNHDLVIRHLPVDTDINELKT